MPMLDGSAIDTCSPLATTDFAFTSTADGDSELYLYRAFDRSIVKLTDNDVQDHMASWSPDGERLAYQSLITGDREIYVYDFATGVASNLTQNPEQDLLPAWSPDGKMIAFFSSWDKPWSGDGPIGGHIFVVSPDGGSPRKLEAPGFVSTTGLAWSPDSRKIAYSRFQDDRPGLYLFDLESGLEEQVLIDEQGAPGLVSFTPDGDSLLYYLDRDGGADLFLLSLADGVSTRVTAGAGFHYHASWSLDGAFLLTTSAQDMAGQRYDIRCLSSDGSINVAVINDESDARMAAWRLRR